QDLVQSPACIDISCSHGPEGGRDGGGIARTGRALELGRQEPRDPLGIAHDAGLTVALETERVGIAACREPAIAELQQREETGASHVTDASRDANARRLGSSRTGVGDRPLPGRTPPFGAPTSPPAARGAAPWRCRRAPADARRRAPEESDGCPRRTRS